MLINYKTLINNWLDENNFYSKNLSYISSDQLNELLKKHNLYNEFPPDLAIFKVNNGKLNCINKDYIVLYKQRACLYVKYIEKLIKKYKINFKENACFIIDLSSASTNRLIYDEVDNVVLSTHVPNIKNQQTIPFTDCHYIIGKRKIVKNKFEHYKLIYNKNIKFSELKWKNKINKIVWRGIGCPTIIPDEKIKNLNIFPLTSFCDDDNEEKNYSFCEIRYDVCKKYFNNTEVDIGFNGIVDESGWSQKYKLYLKESLSIKQMSDYKYIIDICGYGATCDATVWKMQSNSLLLWWVDDIFFKNQSPLWSAWYTPLLKPYIHYVPFNTNNLIEIYNWCESNEKKCLEIIHNSKEIINFILDIWDDANAYILYNMSLLN